MDFGAVGLDGLVVGFSSTTTTPSLDPEAKERPYGSGFFKAERSSGFDDEWRSSKLAKTDDFSAPKAMQRSTITSLRSHTSLFSDAQQNQHMLCFSSPKSDAALPYLNYQSPSAHSNYAGFNFGSLSAASMQGVMGGSRGPFTPSQWMELEHQALIYKYINANVPVPSNLLIPIKKAFESAGFSCYPGGLLRHNSLGWGSFHLGFSSSTDPEPGRCRRTDGKKWRCSRDAVADQKYCERHMNRGRHRSRKPVEGQNGHPVSGATTTTSTKQSTTSLLPSVASSPSVVPAGGPSSISYNATAAHHLQPSGLSLSADNTINRFFMNKENVTEKLQDQPDSFSILSPHVDLKPKENPFLMMKQNLPYDDPSRLKFGTDSSGSVLNFRNLGTLKELTDRDTDSQHSSVHQFMNDERTHLSISIPMASSDLIPSTSSSNQDKLTLSPLNLAGGSVMNEPLHRQTNWIPISWENSMGGPLGEVLHNASNNNSCSTDCMTSSGLNLMTDGWDSSSPLGSSPTGVLHKSTFESVSNSSAGSSPRAAAEDIRKQLE